MNTPNWRERLLNLPLPVVVLVVSMSGFALGVMLTAVVKRLVASAPSGIASVAQLGVAAIVVVTLFTVFKWLLDTLIIWIAVRITANLSGEPFEMGFLEGYRSMLPITMLMVVNSTLALLIAVVTGFWLMPFAAWFVDLVILRLFLEMDWYEILILNAVLGFFSCATGGLL